MTNVDPNLRKAAVLLRSLDADTAAMMLGQLSADQASAIRVAMRRIGAMNTDEQSDVMAELRRSQTSKPTSKIGDVELSLSSSFADHVPADTFAAQSAAAGSKRFEFLESAPTHALVPYLAREHAQTIAVVLSHLAPERAAAVLAALPQKVQSDAIERLSTLGDTDAECVSVLERELEAWLAKRHGAQTGARRRDTMATILAAADANDRSSILSNMKRRHTAATIQRSATHSAQSYVSSTPIASEYRNHSPKIRLSIEAEPRREKLRELPIVLPAPKLPRMEFDDLIDLDSPTLASVLRQVDANVLALALAGSREEMVDRICEQMPKRTAREFRRELRRLGPTRLSDVEAAQQAVARIAARQLANSGIGFQPAGNSLLSG